MMSEQPGEVPGHADERTALEEAIHQVEFVYHCLVEHQANLSLKLSRNNANLEAKADELFKLRNRLRKLQQQT